MNAWKPLLVRGGLAVSLATALFVLRRAALEPIALALGGYTLVDGAVALAFGADDRSRRGAELHLLEGLVLFGFGLAALRSPASPSDGVYVLALWAIGSGLFRIGGLFRAILDRRETRADLLLAAGGAFTEALGLALALWPIAGQRFFVLALAAYVALAGASVVRSAWRARAWLRRTERAASSGE